MPKDSWRTLLQCSHDLRTAGAAQQEWWAAFACEGIRRAQFPQPLAHLASSFLEGLEPSQVQAKLTTLNGHVFNGSSLPRTEVAQLVSGVEVVIHLFEGERMVAFGKCEVKSEQQGPVILLRREVIMRSENTRARQTNINYNVNFTQLHTYSHFTTLQLILGSCLAEATSYGDFPMDNGDRMRSLWNVDGIRIDVCHMPSGAAFCLSDVRYNRSLKFWARGAAHSFSLFPVPVSLLPKKTRNTEPCICIRVWGYDDDHEEPWAVGLEIGHMRILHPDERILTAQDVNEGLSDTLPL
jgi:hypothetical protein